MYKKCLQLLAVATQVYRLMASDMEILSPIKAEQCWNVILGIDLSATSPGPAKQMVHGPVHSQLVSVSDDTITV